MAVCLLTLLFLLVPSVISSQLVLNNSSWWPCPMITPLENLQLDQVLGQWYLVEMISPLASRAATCAGIELFRPNNHTWSNLTMVGQESPGGNSIFYENHGIIVIDPERSPSLWNQPDIDATVMVVDVGPNNDTLALTTCQRFLGFDWTGIFSRERTLDPTTLDLVNDRLRTAGVQHVDNAVPLNTTMCPLATSRAS